MKSSLAVMIAITLSCPLGVSPAQRPQPSLETRRRIVHKVSPRYPEPALRMSVGGTVKVVAVVGADGSVKKVDPVGGNPILIEAAQNAVAQWKYAPGAESHEMVELHFTP